MKSTVETMQSDSVGVRSAWGVFADLVKARLTALVLLTTLSGFYLASANPMNWGLLFHILLGTGLLACGASVLNQYSERETVSAGQEGHSTKFWPFRSREVITAGFAAPRQHGFCFRAQDSRLGHGASSAARCGLLHLLSHGCCIVSEVLLSKINERRSCFDGEQSLSR